MARPKFYNHGYLSTTSLLDIIDKPGLRYWYGAKGTTACETIKKESQGLGHKVHKAVELFLKGEEYDAYYEGLNETEHEVVQSIISWCIKLKLKPIALEEPLYWYCPVHHPKPHKKKDCSQDCPKDCEEFTLSGTPDVICTFNDDRTLMLVDWKTDSIPTDTAQERERAIKYYWQMVSYSMMYNKMHGARVDKAIIVRSAPIDKVKVNTQDKTKLTLGNYVDIAYSKDLTFCTYTFANLHEGINDIKALRRIYRLVKGK